MPGATAAAGQRGEAAPGQAGQLPGSVVTNVHLLGRLGLMASSPSVTLKSRNTFFRPKKKTFYFWMFMHYSSLAHGFFLYTLSYDSRSF